MEIKNIEKSLRSLQKDTIIIFMNDNGASILDKLGDDKKGPRGCNYPYRLGSSKINFFSVNKSSK